MIEHVFRSARVPRRLHRSLLGLRVFDALTEYLVDRGHSATMVQQYVQSVEHFGGWLRRRSSAAARAITRAAAAERLQPSHAQ